MFGWDFNRKSDRVKLFFFIFVIFLGIAYTMFFVIGYLKADQKDVYADDKRQIQQHEKLEGQEKSEVPASKPWTDSKEKNEKSDQPTITENEKSNDITPENKEKTKKIAVAFAKSFYTYDSSHPLSYLKDSREYMTQELYQSMKKHPRRQILSRSKTKVLSTDVTPVADQGDGSVYWNVIVHGKATSSKGKSHKEENWYIVELKKQDDQWKVEGVTVNAPN